MEHIGERPYKCSECGKSYTTNGNLRKHLMKVHENPYRCNQCYKVFATINSLEVHMQYHTGERLNKYKYCDKSFITNSHLHLLKKHTDSRNHSLQNHNSNISINPSDNTKSRFFACFICKEKFDNLNTCRIHMKAHMKSKIPTLSKCGSTCQKNNTDSTDEISIKVEHDIDGVLKHELEDYVEDKGIHPSIKVINQSEKNLQKTKKLDGKEQVSIKMEETLVK